MNRLEQAFEDKYQANHRDPMVAEDLARFTDGWSAALSEQQAGTGEPSTDVPMPDGSMFCPESTLEKCNSQGAPKQHFCEKPVAGGGFRDNYHAGRFLSEMVMEGLFHAKTPKLLVDQIASVMNYLCKGGPSDGAQAAVVDKSTPQE